MNTTIINFKTDKTVKEKAQKVAKQMGLNLSDIMNVYLRDFIKKRELNIKLEEPNGKTIKKIKNVLKEIKNGNVSPSFDDVSEAIKWLDEESKKYAD
ncbi:MAG: type II toxin-antitoxin system RelB/DinJ family antitoxin [Candidatus Paceibacterota bacterium]|jgi:addiction module RelB/DinJ family antitoxin